MIDDEPNWIGARDWAKRAGMSTQRARQLARLGKVPARRLGGVWVLDADAALGRSRGHGRPLSARSAWAIIDTLDGRIPQDVSRSERARARQRARSADQFESGQLAGRAALRSFHGHPGVLRRLDADPQLLIGGARAAAHHGADIVALDHRELYVRQRDLDRLVRRYGLRETRGNDANVRLRISTGLPASDHRFVSAATAALDLLDAGDERSVRAARRMLDELRARSLGR